MNIKKSILSMADFFGTALLFVSGYYLFQLGIAFGGAFVCFIILMVQFPAMLLEPLEVEGKLLVILITLPVLIVFISLFRDVMIKVKKEKGQ